MAKGLRKIIGLALFILVVFMGIGFNIGVFIDIPSIAFVVVGGFGITLARFKEKSSKNEILTDLRRNILLMGIIGAFTGLILMFGNLSDFSTLGASVAVNLLPIFWALICYALISIFITE